MESVTESHRTDTLVPAARYAEDRDCQVTLPDTLPNLSGSLGSWEFEDLIDRRESGQDTYKW